MVVHFSIYLFFHVRKQINGNMTFLNDNPELNFVFQSNIDLCLCKLLVTDQFVKLRRIYAYLHTAANLIGLFFHSICLPNRAARGSK